MEKEKSPNLGGSLLPPSGRFSSFPPPGINVKPEPSGSSSLPPIGPGASSETSHFGHGMATDSGRFSHDISGMPDNPPKKLGHRRAHSEILTLPDDISFDSDLGVVGGFDGPSFSDETEEDLFSMYLDMDKFNMSATSSFQVGEPSGASASRSSQSPALVGLNVPAENVPPPSSERPRVRHQHSLSMDGSTTIKPEMLMSGTEEGSLADKKSMSAAKLAELALIDPKRAKRIWANRQSAARSKERKMRYIAELERKVQTLQTEATSLSAQLTLLQRDTTGLTAENSELKLRLQTMEQQVRLQDALNDALKEEIQHLKVMTSQAIPNGGPMMNPPPAPFGGQQQYYANNQAMHPLQQFQQLQIRSQKQQLQHLQQQQQQQFQLQLHQFQQQQMQQRPQVQPHQQEQRIGGGMKSGGSSLSTSQNENISDVNMPPSNG